MQGSNTNSNFDDVNDLGGDTTLIAGNDTIIANAILNEYHHSSRSVSNRGMFKGVTAATSTLIDAVTLPINLAIAIYSPIAKNIDDPIQRFIEEATFLPSSISDKIDYDYLRNKYKDTVYENQYHNTQIDTRNRHNLTNIVSSNVNAGNDLTLAATNEITVQGSNLRAGLGEYTSSNNPTSSYDEDKANNSRDNATSNANITGNLTIDSNGLSILSATSYDSRSINKETERTNSIRTNVTNNTAIINTDSTLGAKNNDFTFNVANLVDVKGSNLGKVTIEPQNVNANNFNKGSYALTTINPPAYLDALRTQLDTDIISETYQNNQYIHTEQTVRELTDVGAATIAVAAVVATIVTAGAAGVTLGVVGGAVASSAAATVAVSGTQASMNADGDSFKQMKDVSKTTWDASTSRDAIEGYAIAGATAYIASELMTLTGLQELKEANEAAKAANNAQSAGSGVTGIGGVGTISANNANNALTGWQQVGVSVAESTISNTTAIATQSAINGESFKDASENLVRNIVIGAIANLAAKEIGATYKDSDKDSLDRTIQLTSHAALGCASGAAAGGDCASGAVSGVVGELVTEMAIEHLNNKTLQENYDKGENPLLTESQFARNKQLSVELAGLASGLSAIFTGNAVGLSDKEVAENIYIGQRVGKNAGENNHLSEVQLSQINEALAENNLIKARLLRIKFSKGKFLTPDQKIKLERYFADKVDTQEFIADLSYYDQITFLPTDQNDNPMAIGVHFDGTGNNAFADKSVGKETNVFRMYELYNNQKTSTYITGSGTSSTTAPDLDGQPSVTINETSDFYQATGLDYSEKTAEASKAILRIYDPSNPKLMLLDLIGFSRGAATAIGYSNDITNNGIYQNDNQIIPGEFIVARSLLLYDTVASFGLAGNDINLGIDLSTPKDAVTIHAVAANEYRDNFDLESIKKSDGSYLNNNSIQKVFLGNHSNIGGSYKGDQIQLRTLNWMINQANNRIPQLTNKDGSKQVIYSQPTANQQPSAEFTRHYDKYEQDKLNYQQIPTYENLLALQSSERVIIDNYVRQEVFTPIDSPWNYDINPGRVSHYPNDIHNKIDQNGLPVRLILKDDSQIDHRNISQSLIF